MQILFAKYLQSSVSFLFHGWTIAIKVQLIIKSLKNYVYNLSGDVFPDTLKSDYEIDLGED